MPVTRRSGAAGARTSRRKASDVSDASASSATRRTTRFAKAPAKKKSTVDPPRPDSCSGSDSDSDADEAVISAVNIAAKAIKDKFASLLSSSSPLSPAPAGNELTHLIPGYTAPMELKSSADSSNMYIDYERVRVDKKKKKKKKKAMSFPAGKDLLLNFLRRRF